MEQKKENEAQKVQQGFAARNPERQREIASQDGKAAPAKRVAHERSDKETNHTGKKEGQVTGKKGYVRQERKDTL